MGGAEPRADRSAARARRAEAQPAPADARLTCETRRSQWVDVGDASRGATQGRSEHSRRQMRFEPQQAGESRVRAMIVQQAAELIAAVPGGMVRERTIGGKILWATPFLLIALPALWSWFRIGQRIWQRRWRQPRWYGRVLWTSSYTAICLWVWALSQQDFMPGDVERRCGYAGQTFDESYHMSHLGPLPPILNSSPCNRNYDLVAVWINPTIVVCLALAVAAVAALTWDAVRPTPDHDSELTTVQPRSSADGQMTGPAGDAGGGDAGGGDVDPAQGGDQASSPVGGPVGGPVESDVRPTARRPHVRQIGARSC